MYRCSASQEQLSRSSDTCRTEARGRGTRLICGISRVCHDSNTYREEWDSWNLSMRADDWQTVMDRDRRLTGFLRGQSDSVKAPAGFELSNPWRVSLVRYLTLSSMILTEIQLEPNIS